MAQTGTVRRVLLSGGRTGAGASSAPLGPAGPLQVQSCERPHRHHHYVSFGSNLFLRTDPRLSVVPGVFTRKDADAGYLARGKLSDRANGPKGFTIKPLVFVLLLAL